MMISEVLVLEKIMRRTFFHGIILVLPGPVTDCGINHDIIKFLTGEKLWNSVAN
jgi:hypothetical protein